MTPTVNPQYTHDRVGPSKEMWPLMILHTKSRMTPQCPLWVKSRHCRA